MSNRLFIGNLPFGIQENDVRDLFLNYGHSVEETTIITDRETGRSRGFGFVTLGDDEDPKQAITQMNGQDFRGRAMTVNSAHPKQSTGMTGARW